jgi:hypothetical protein
MPTAPCWWCASKAALESLTHRPLFTEVPRRSQAVEKVVVAPAGGSNEARNKARTLRKRRSQPLNRGAEKSAKECFNTLERSRKLDKLFFRQTLMNSAVGQPLGEQFPGSLGPRASFIS